MSDKSLREALQELCDGSRVVMTAEVRSVLAAHPAEPAPVVTDEAIDHLGRWRWERYDTEIPHQHAQSIAFARQFLEGLIPLLGPRPLLEREAVRSLLQEWRVGPIRPDATQGEHDNYRRKLTNALLELARPVPTREAIAAALDPTAFNARKDDASYENRRKLALSDADAILALLTGSAK